jgi:hypothetical protein
MDSSTSFSAIPVLGVILSGCSLGHLFVRSLVSLVLASENAGTIKYTVAEALSVKPVENVEMTNAVPAIEVKEG